MDFIDELKQFSERAKQLKEHLPTEEATKNALVMPFFQLMGYDVFNPIEFKPEFIADVGIKKGEKVDYAIYLNDKLCMLVEAKGITMYHPFNGWFDFAPIRGLLLATPKGVVPQAFSTYSPLRGFDYV